MLSSDKNTHTSSRIANEVRHRSDALNNANHPSRDMSRRGGRMMPPAHPLILRTPATAGCWNLNLCEVQNRPPQRPEKGGTDPLLVILGNRLTAFHPKSRVRTMKK